MEAQPVHLTSLSFDIIHVCMCMFACMWARVSRCACTLCRTEDNLKFHSLGTVLFGLLSQDISLARNSSARPDSLTSEPQDGLLVSTSTALALDSTATPSWLLM